MDELYVAKTMAGDTDAFRYFIQKYQDMAYSLAFSILKQEFLAEEAVQDAFVNAFIALDSFSSRSTFKTWFYRIVLNECFRRRKKQKSDLLELSDYDEEVPDESLFQASTQEELKVLVTEALHQLPEREAIALRLFYLEEESIKEITEITGWTEANAKVILHRARKNMLSVMNKLMKHG